jgi:uncharacterized protein (DUF302 family)
MIVSVGIHGAPRALPKKHSEEDAMVDDGRRVLIDLPFETAVAEAVRAIDLEGLAIIARIDVREHFRKELHHEFRQYLLIEAWVPALVFEEIRTDLDEGPRVPIRFAIYELADGETAVTVDERSSPAARVLGRLRRLPRAAPATPAA